MAEEGLKRTENDLIHIGCPIPFDTDEFLGELDDLMGDYLLRTGKIEAEEYREKQTED